MVKEALFSSVIFFVSGCSVAPYELVKGEFSYVKEDGSTYKGTSMFRFDNKTGETWRMNFQSDRRYYWEKVE